MTAAQNESLLRAAGFEPVHTHTDDPSVRTWRRGYVSAEVTHNLPADKKVSSAFQQGILHVIFPEYREED